MLEQEPFGLAFGGLTKSRACTFPQLTSHVPQTICVIAELQFDFLKVKERLHHLRFIEQSKSKNVRKLLRPKTWM